MVEDAKRFNLVETAVAAPGVDFITKSPNGPFVDTGYNLTFAEWKSGSHIYLSVDTVRELAAAAGILDEEKLTGVAVQEAAWYNRGYGDAVKENLGGDLRDIADRLGVVAGYLAGLGADPVVPESEEPERNEPEVFDNYESKPRAQRKAADGADADSGNPFRQGNGAGSKQGSDDVPAASVDESVFRI